MSAAMLPRIYIRPPNRVQASRLREALWLLTGAILVPVYWLLAALRSAPGLWMRRQCFILGMRFLVFPKARCRLETVVRLMLAPMDSTRYFEFDYVRRALAERPIAKLLDVSSPRAVPVMLARERGALVAELVNPSAKDLADTREMIDAAGLSARCQLHGCLISQVPFGNGSFDVITCISVLEHIPQDSAALEKMWSLLKPGGVLVLTVPCMARACEQYTDRDEYGLLSKDSEGFVFWQRYYDSALLRERIFKVLGAPAKTEVFGEKTAGSFARNAQSKARVHGYPFWIEPYMMARDYRYFDSLEELPGEGVIGLTFVKPSATGA
jgi:SAM-dependent methyltransferase